MSDQASKIGRGLPARRGKRCAHQGRKYQHNSLFKPSSCNICECDDGRVECEQIQCDVLMCPVQVTPEGACCPICDDKTRPGDRPADIQGMRFDSILVWKKEEKGWHERELRSISST